MPLGKQQRMSQLLETLSSTWEIQTKSQDPDFGPAQSHQLNTKTPDGCYLFLSFSNSSFQEKKGNNKKSSNPNTIIVRSTVVGTLLPGVWGDLPALAICVGWSCSVGTWNLDFKSSYGLTSSLKKTTTTIAITL